MLQLLIATPHGGEERVVLEHDEYILGRDPTVSIPLRDRKVSRQHARIFRRGNAYFIEDMGSVNGVLAGGVAIQSPMKLAPGVELDVGGFILTLLAEQSGRHLTFMFTGRTAPFAGQEFLLPEGDLEVGRVDGNAIVIPDPSVSRNHAQVTVSEHSVIVEDLGSSNGTLINGERITSRTLAHGDVVSFGNVEFEFQTGGGASDHSGPFFQQLLASTNTIRLALGLAGATTVALIGALALELGPWSHAPRAPIGARELEYERSIDEALKKAERAAQAKDWSLAKTNYDAVLSQDPVNVAARDGLRSVNFNRQHAAV
ncbi:MAG: FHA domain-containing protein, partial [Myxococcota bacterium]